jgi:hypothetical protein
VSLFGALWQTALTWWRQWGLRCPHCATRMRQAKLKPVVTPRGYVLRCRQCGSEYVEHPPGLRRVWPILEKVP